jgi:acyl-coenzyme A thioesterase PaaI-like protein
MKHKVVKKQYNYKNCVVCGADNDLGFHASFYEMDDGKLVCLTAGREEHQSYPERKHGGMIAALLDEAIGRAILMTENIWGVTFGLTMKYLKPVPLSQPIKIVAEVTENLTRTFKGSALLFDRENNLLAECEAAYFKIPYAQMEHLEAEQHLIADNITEIEY